MLKNGINLFSRQSSNLNLVQRLLCRNFITFTRYTNFRAINRLPNQMPLISFQTQSMCSREDFDDSNKNSNTNNQIKEIYVGNLPWRADDHYLGEFFSQYGEVESARVPMNEEGRSKGFGFVKFFSSEDCAKVLSENEITMEGRTIRVNPSSSSRNPTKRVENRREFNQTNPQTNTLFVGGLSYYSTEETIKEFFEECGEVVDVRIAFSEGRSRGFCHVEFDSVESASKAMKKNGENLDGRTLRLDFSKSR